MTKLPKKRARAVVITLLGWKILRKLDRGRYACAPSHVCPTRGKVRR